MLGLNKLTKLILFSVFILLVTIGCTKKTSMTSNSGTDKFSNLTTKSINEEIRDKVVFRDELVEVTSDNIDNVYSKLDKTLLEDYTIYVSGSGATAEEISVFKVKNDWDIESIKESIETRIQEQTTNFKDYVPEEVYKLKNNVVKVYGNFIIYVASDTPDEVPVVLDEFVNTSVNNTSISNTSVNNTESLSK